MKDLFGDFLRGIIYLFKEYPVITCILAFIIFFYYTFKVLPKQYRNREGGVYTYYQRLSLYSFLSIFFLMVFIIQFIRIIA
ncbi:hypothetical protein [Tenacibaculum sp. 190130A14a]|uniref:hypothetical protein n=1 Tax=Tenacibaculum polynesiense TaxID=3137857 RepID=UPI0032B1F4C5